MPIPNEHDLIAQIKELKEKLFSLETASEKKFSSSEFDLIKLTLELEKSRRASSVIETRYDLIYSQPYLGIAYFDDTKKIIDCNDRFAELIGYSKGELIESKFLDLFENKSIFTSLQDAMVGLSPTFEGKYENQIKCIDIYIRGYFLGTMQSGNSYGINAVIFEDISAVKQVEYKYDLLSHSFKNIDECVVITDSQNRVIFANNAFVKLYGYELNEVIGKNLSVIRAVDTQKKVNDIIYKSNSSLKSWKGILLHTKKDGTEFPVSLSLTVVKNSNSSDYIRICIIRDITEEKEIESELFRTKKKAEQSDRLKSEFLGQISHEIRTPVNIMVNVSNMILEDFYYKADNESKIAFSILNSAGKRIVRTIDLILNISEIQAGTYKSTFRKFDLFAETYSLLYREFKMLAKEEDLELSWIKKTDNTLVYGDSASLLEVFSNILHNSIKYTNIGEVLVVFREGSNKNLIVDFIDSGVGISEEFLSKIFNTFSQEDSGHTRKYEGNGLGLALAKAYCDMNGVQIKIKSVKGIGSTFTLVFPK